MTPIARYPAISWILLAVTVKILIAAASNIQIEPFIKITLQHPSTIALQFRSPQYLQCETQTF